MGPTVALFTLIHPKSFSPRVLRRAFAQAPRAGLKDYTINIAQLLV